MPGEIYDFVPRWLNRTKPVGADRDVLEIGCGAQQYRNLVEGRYRGLDLPDSPYIEDRPAFESSAESISAPDGSFDIVFGVATFVLIPDVDVALAECHRVLRPGGSLVIFDYQPSVLEHLHASDPVGHFRVWDARDLRARLVRAGFAQRAIADRSLVVDGPSVPRLLARRLRALTGNRGRWLAMEARR